MPFIVQNLIEGNPDPVSVSPDEPVLIAIHRMTKDDYSQLPVVNEDKRPIGMVTSESILAAVHTFKVPLEQLRVKDVMIKVVEADEFRSDADLFELLDRLREKYAVLIVNGERHLVGIVTNYDSGKYFQRRAEDLMLIEDIETMLRDYIQAAFVIGVDEIDTEALNEAALEISDWRKTEWDRFKMSLSEYLQFQSGRKNGGLPKTEWLELVRQKHYEVGPPPRSFKDLTLNEYISMFLHKERWEIYRPIFVLEPGIIRKLLDDVRKIRNILAHFRDELTQEQRDQLRFCADWLARYQSEIAKLLLSTETEEIEESTVEVKVEDQIQVKDDGSAEIPPTEEEPAPTESRYAPLAIWLQSQPIEKKKVRPTFSEIEKIIDSSLPQSAYAHRSWWANDSVSHVQSQQWLDVGWRVASVNMTDQVVRFTRIKERERAYIDFFNDLMMELENQSAFSNLRRAHDGSSWHLVHSIFAEGTNIASFNYSFGRGHTFRIELYIDMGDQKKNKQIFDRLYFQRDEIEELVGHELSWQRLNKRRASRIAIIHSGSITDSSEKTSRLRHQAVQSMVAFKEAILIPTQSAGAAVIMGK